MKLLFKLTITAVLVMGAYILYQENLPLLDILQRKEDPLPMNGDFTPNQEVKPANTKTELDTILYYMPFLGFKLQDITSVDGSDIQALHGRRFMYENNVLEVYQMDLSSVTAQERVAEIQKSNIITRKVDGQEKRYVAITMRTYVLILVHVDDLAVLKDAYDKAIKTAQNLGVDLS